MLTAFLEFILARFNLSKPFVAILEPVLEKAGETFLTDATVAAQPIVAALESGTLPSKQKAEDAAAQLIAKLKADGKALLPSVANLAVELALQKIRSAV